MKMLDIRAKTLLLCQKVGLTEKQFVSAAVAQSQLPWTVVENWLKPDVQLRRRGSEAFLAFWHGYNIPITRMDFYSTLEEFESRLDSLNPTTSPAPQSVTARERESDLIGRYQVIRPHAIFEGTYLLEAMEIELHGDHLKTLFFTHHRVDQSFMYEGVGHAERRYYFSLMSRKHEEFEDHQSHRCISFSNAEGRLRPCISGVMLRGVTGGMGKESVALPFVALPVRKSHSLRKIDPVAILTQVEEEPDLLQKVHRDGNLLIGEVWERWHKPIHAICDCIFESDPFKKATKKTKDSIIWTVPPGTLRNIEAISEKRWCAAVDSLAIET